MKEKFMEMVKTMDMSYSYKPVLLKAMLEEPDEKGKVLIEDIVDYFIDFYEDRKSRGLKAEKKKCVYNNDVIDREDVKRNILCNPFKRFEDMRSCGNVWILSMWGLMGMCGRNLVGKRKSGLRNGVRRS